MADHQWWRFSRMSHLTGKWISRPLNNRSNPAEQNHVTQPIRSEIWIRMTTLVAQLHSGHSPSVDLSGTFYKLHDETKMKMASTSTTGGGGG